MRIGVYYFGGWAGTNALAEDANSDWARTAPTHLTRRLVEEFPEREPIWGWRDDSLEIMERQIDLAADSGIDFFAFCWYWRDDRGPLNHQKIETDPLHVALNLYLKARNNHRLKFCLLIANHQGFEIIGIENWTQAAKCWLPYLTHKQYVTVEGKPLIIIFNPAGAGAECFAALTSEAESASLPGIAVAGCGVGSAVSGCTHVTRYNVIPNRPGESEPHKFSELHAANKAAWSGSREQPCIPIVTAGWDKRPWEGPAGLKQTPGWYFPDRSPDQVAHALREADAWMEAHSDRTTAERIILVYAWNEFGEGGYIAPTRGDAEGKYLEAIRLLVKYPL